MIKNENKIISSPDKTYYVQGENSDFLSNIMGIHFWVFILELVNTGAECWVHWC